MDEEREFGQALMMRLAQQEKKGEEHREGGQSMMMRFQQHEERMNQRFDEEREAMMMRMEQRFAKRLEEERQLITSKLQQQEQAFSKRMHEEIEARQAVASRLQEEEDKTEFLTQELIAMRGKVDALAGRLVSLEQKSLDTDSESSSAASSTDLTQSLQSLVEGQKKLQSQTTKQQNELAALSELVNSQPDIDSAFEDRIGKLEELILHSQRDLLPSEPQEHHIHHDDIERKFQMAESKRAELASKVDQEQKDLLELFAGHTTKLNEIRQKISQHEESTQTSLQTQSEAIEQLRQLVRQMKSAQDIGLPQPLASPPVGTPRLNRERSG